MRTQVRAKHGHLVGSSSNIHYHAAVAILLAQTSTSTGRFPIVFVLTVDTLLCNRRGSRNEHRRTHYIPSRFAFLSVIIQYSCLRKQAQTDRDSRCWPTPGQRRFVAYRWSCFAYGAYSIELAAKQRPLRKLIVKTFCLTRGGLLFRFLCVWRVPWCTSPPLDDLHVH